MLGLFALGYRMHLSPENAVHVIPRHRKHLFGRGDILAPLTRGENPEGKKGKRDQPGQPHKIVHLHRRLEAKQSECPVDLKAGQPKDDDQHRLQPVPQSLKARVLDHIFFYCKC